MVHRRGRAAMGVSGAGKPISFAKAWRMASLMVSGLASSPSVAVVSVVLTRGAYSFSRAVCTHVPNVCSF